MVIQSNGVGGCFKNPLEVKASPFAGGLPRSYYTTSHLRRARKQPVSLRAEETSCNLFPPQGGLSYFSHMEEVKGLRCKMLVQTPRKGPPLIVKYSHYKRWVAGGGGEAVKN